MAQLRVACVIYWGALSYLLLKASAILVLIPLLFFKKKYISHLKKMKIQTLIVFVTTCVGISVAECCKPGYYGEDYRGIGLLCFQKCRPYYDRTGIRNYYKCSRLFQSIGVHNDCGWHSPSHTTFAGSSKICWVHTHDYTPDSYLLLYDRMDRSCL